MENMILNIRLMKHQIEMINSTIGYDSEISAELDRMIREIENEMDKFGPLYGDLGFSGRIAIEAARAGIRAILGPDAKRESVANDAEQLYKVAENALNRYYL